MISRSRVLGFALQGSALAGLLALGVYVYDMKSTLDLYDSRHNPASAAAIKTEGAVDAHGSLHRADTIAPESAYSLRDVAQRMDRLEKQVTELGVLLSNISAASAIPAATAKGADSAPPEDAAELERLTRQADLAARHASETGSSPWGEAAATAIDSAYTNALATDAFLARHGGNLATDCKESVCSLTWSPDQGNASGLTDEERADLLDRGSWALISLLGHTREVGQFKIVANADSNPPSIQLMVDRAPGGTPIPDRVSSYLSATKASP